MSSPVQQRAGGLCSRGPQRAGVERWGGRANRARLGPQQPEDLNLDLADLQRMPQRTMHCSHILLCWPSLLAPHADEGPYAGGAFLFAFSIPEGYPHDPPNVACLTKVE